jgi:hypothetical protein
MAKLVSRINMMWRISSLSENPHLIVRGYLGPQPNQTGEQRAHPCVAFSSHLGIPCLRESCMRENRTCS